MAADESRTSSTTRTKKLGYPCIQLIYYNEFSFYVFISFASKLKLPSEWTSVSMINGIVAIKYAMGISLTEWAGYFNVHIYEPLCKLISLKLIHKKGN